MKWNFEAAKNQCHPSKKVWNISTPNQKLNHVRVIGQLLDIFVQKIIISVQNRSPNWVLTACTGTTKVFLEWVIRFGLTYLSDSSNICFDRACSHLCTIFAQNTLVLPGIRPNIRLRPKMQRNHWTSLTCCLAL